MTDSPASTDPTKKSPKRAGRPPLPRGEKKDRQIKLVVTQDQWRILEAAAKRDRLTPSEWIRTVALRAAEKPPAGK